MKDNPLYGFKRITPDKIVSFELSNIYTNTMLFVCLGLTQIKNNLIPSSFCFKNGKNNIIKFIGPSFTKQTSFLDNLEIKLKLLFPNNIEEGNYCIIGDLYIDNIGIYEGFTIMIDIHNDYNQNDLYLKDQYIFINKNLYNDVFPTNNESEKEKLKQQIQNIKVRNLSITSEMLKLQKENEYLRRENTKLMAKQNQMESFEKDKVKMEQKKKENNSLKVVKNEINLIVNQNKKDKTENKILLKN